jgi:hypothetical protein
MMLLSFQVFGELSLPFMFHHDQRTHSDFNFLHLLGFCFVDRMAYLDTYSTVTLKELIFYYWTVFFNVNEIPLVNGIELLFIFADSLFVLLTIERRVLASPSNCGYVYFSFSSVSV